MIEMMWKFPFLAEGGLCSLPSEIEGISILCGHVWLPTQSCLQASPPATGYALVRTFQVLMEATSCAPEVPSEQGGWWGEDPGEGQGDRIPHLQRSLAVCLGTSWALEGWEEVTSRLEVKPDSRSMPKIGPPCTPTYTRSGSLRAPDS